ncbi:hypothetical protein V1512DRAFT_241882 [Lipomyces arxii]|uniref:uncharacterized protein n=1 Tax=Lipomyces arxii TaxID=56418 RepID=UPI0034D012F2
MSVDEITFSKAFLHLLANRPIQYSDDYKIESHQLGERTGLVLLTHMPYDKRKRDRNATVITNASLSIKSIRAPKFAISVNAPYTDTMLNIKSKIATETGIALNGLKLLVKGKVLPDTRSVREIVDENGAAAIMVMVTPTTAPTSEMAPTQTIDVNEENRDIEKEIDEDTWLAIEHLVREKLGTVQGAKSFAKLKQGYLQSK